MAKKKLQIRIGAAPVEVAESAVTPTVSPVAPVPQFKGALPIGLAKLHEVAEGKADGEIDTAIRRVLKSGETPKRMKIRISQVSPDPNQPRANSPDIGDVSSLAQSIERDGLLQPIGVLAVEDGYRLLYGERRYRAHLHLGRNEIDVIVYPSLDEIQVRRIQLMENIQRKDLDPYREATAMLDWIVLELGERNVLPISDGLQTARRQLISILRKMKREKDRGKTANPVPEEIKQAVALTVKGSGRWSWESFVSSRLVYVSMPDDLVEASKKGITHKNLLQLAKLTARALGCSAEIATEIRKAMLEPAQAMSKDAFRKHVDDFLLLPEDVRFAAADGLEFPKLFAVGQITAEAVGCSEQDARIKRAELLGKARIASAESLLHDVASQLNGGAAPVPHLKERRDAAIRKAVKSLRRMRRTSLTADQVQALEVAVEKLALAGKGIANE
jgi:ParB/RepB/Spo0J family partition protein